MGMLDQQLVRWDEHFKYGQSFKLEDAKKGPEIDTDYGTSRPAMLKINGSWYSLFGSALLDQIDRMDDADRAAMRSGGMLVKVAKRKTKVGNEVKLLVAADTPTDENGNITSDDIPL